MVIISMTIELANETLFRFRPECNLVRELLLANHHSFILLTML